MPRFIRESKRRNGIERGKDIALTGGQCSTKRRIKVILCGDAPGEKLFGLAVTGFAKEALSDAGFDFARMRNCVVLIEANDPAEVPNAGYVVIDNPRLDHVLPLRLTSVPYPLECRRAQFETELAVSVDQASRDRHAIDELLVVIYSPESRCAGDAKPRSPAHRKSQVRCDF